jgi:uncharacterized protein YecT (DUF1311 family)
VILRAGAVLAALCVMLAARGAAAQECALIAGFADRLTCANPALHAATATMNAAYAALAARSDARTRARLARAQRHWSALRMRACDVRRDWEDESKARCLIAMTERRSAALAAGRIAGELVAEAAPGQPLVVETRVFSAPRQRCSVVLRFPRFAGPQLAATAFDIAVREIIFAPTTSAARNCAQRNRAFAYHDYDLDFSVTWHTDRIIAIAFDEYIDTGNAHPVVTIRSFAIDLARRHAVALDRLFDAPALAQIERDCRTQIEDANGANAIIDGALLGGMLRQIEFWTITPRGATITFPRYTILNGVAPGGECTFTQDVLRPLQRPGNPLW